MMKNIASFLPLLCLLAGLPFQVFSTHFQGAEVTYEYQGNGIYSVIVSEYYDCAGTPLPFLIPSSTVSFSGIGTSCTFSSPTPVGSWSFLGNTDVSNLAPMAFPNGSSCTGQPGASAIGVTKVVFSRDYDFTGITCGVTIGLSSCCRNGAVLNLTNPGSVSYWVSTQMMDPSLGNHGPTWLDPSFTLFAQNQPLRASMAAYDQDGDSLVSR